MITNTCINKYIKIQNCAFTMQVSSVQLLTAFYLQSFQQACCFPSVRNIAENINACKHTIINTTNKLQEKDFLTKQSRYLERGANKGKRTSNSYEVKCFDEYLIEQNKYDNLYYGSNNIEYALLFNSAYNGRLSPNDKKVLAILHCNTDDKKKKTCTLSIKNLANKAHLSNTTIIKIIKKLDEIGLIYKEHRINKYSKNQSAPYNNIYILYTIEEWKKNVLKKNQKEKEKDRSAIEILLDELSKLEELSNRVAPTSAQYKLVPAYEDDSGGLKNN